MTTTTKKNDYYYKFICEAFNNISILQPNNGKWKTENGKYTFDKNLSHFLSFVAISYDVNKIAYSIWPQRAPQVQRNEQPSEEFT